MSTPPEQPHLPFEGGLPEFEPPKKKRRRKSQVGAIMLPVVNRWIRLRRWSGRYAQDVGYGVVVKLGVSGVLAVMGVGGVIYGDQQLDIFGRHAKPKEEARIETKPVIPPEKWMPIVERGR